MYLRKLVVMQTTFRKEGVVKHIIVFVIPTRKQGVQIVSGRASKTV